MPGDLNERPYPDSVNRVRPPKTTMPKTLAALPNSQYATDFELVSGNELFALLEVGIVWPMEVGFVVFLANPPNELEDAVVLENLVLWKKLDLIRCGAIDAFGRERQRWQMKKSLDNFGITALRRPGSIFEAIGVVFCLHKISYGLMKVS